VPALLEFLGPSVEIHETFGALIPKTGSPQTAAGEHAATEATAALPAGTRKATLPLSAKTGANETHDGLP
jgi:hypothetical protein